MSESIPNWLKKRAYLTPNRTGLRFKGKQYSFKEMYEESLTIAQQIHTLGMKDNGTVAVLLKNDAHTVFILFALHMCGQRTVLLNTRLTAAELVYQMEDSRAALLITEDDFRGKIEDMNGKPDDVQLIFKNELFSLDCLSFSIKEEFALNDVCTIMYTSGTTGRPKGVLQTYGNHWWSAIGSVLNLGLKEDDCWLAVVPLFHISGFSILIRSVVYGITVDLHESFDEKRVNEHILNDRVTIISVVSSMLTRLIEDLRGTHYPETFRCMLLGGGPAPRPLLEQCVQLKIPVFQTYGMTETSSQIVTLAPEDSLSKLGSAGKPLFPAQLRIETADGHVQAENTPGEIVVKGPNVTKGYVNHPFETANNGWFRTGDIGYLDEGGYLYVLDRRSDLIISGGENVYPAEIEAVLLAHPDVIDAGVIGAEDVTWGQVPIGFVVLDAMATTTEADLVVFCETFLATYKIPKTFIFRQQLPRSATKKLLRKDLRELFNT